MARIFGNDCLLHWTARPPSGRGWWDWRLHPDYAVNDTYWESFDGTYSIPEIPTIILTCVCKIYLIFDISIFVQRL